MVDDAADFIARLTDAQDAITRAIGYLEAGELTKAWRVLKNQEEADNFSTMVVELEKVVPDWQMGGFRSEEACLEFQLQDTLVIEQDVAEDR